MNIVIIGNGITGISCARTLRKNSDAKITVISSETKHFWSRTALMYIFMGHMKFEDTKPYEDGFWKKNRIELKEAHIENIDFENQQLKTDAGEQVGYDKLLIATGAKPNFFNWPGQDLEGVSGMYSYQDLQRIEEISKDANSAVIIGGGLIGIELAEMLHSRGISVKMLIREDGFWRNVLPRADSDFVQNHIQSHGIELILNDELMEIIPNGNNKVKGIKTKAGKDIECQFVGITAGVSPNISFLMGSELNMNRGVLINSKLETSQKHVYAAGDCAEFNEPPVGRSKIEQVWYTGRQQGELAGLNILGADLEYNPGPWFNSAKFFDLEYQTYGSVSAEPQGGTSDLIFGGEDKYLVHLVYSSENQNVIGVNFFGVRQRHDMWDKWLRDRVQLSEAILGLGRSDFQPEFSKGIRSDAIRAYNEAFPNSPLPISEMTEKIIG